MSLVDSIVSKTNADLSSLAKNNPVKVENGYLNSDGSVTFNPKTVMNPNGDQFYNTGIVGSLPNDLNTNTGINGEKSQIEKSLEPILIGGGAIPHKKGYTDSFYYSRIGIDGSQIKISERLKKWNDNDVEKAFNMIPYPVINPDPSMKMAKSTSEIDDAIIVEMERRNNTYDHRPRLLGDFSEPDKYYIAKKIGLMLLIVFGGIAALVFAYKKYPTATKWIVGISVALFALVFICFFLFFSMGGPNKYERYLQKYIEPSKHKESTKIKEVDYTLAQPAVI